MWGFQPIMDDSALSKKLLNDQLEALWNKVMGGIDYRDLSGSMRGVIKAQGDEVGSLRTEIAQQADEIALRAEKSDVDTLGGRVTQQSAQLSVQAGQIAAKVDAAQVGSLIQQNADSVRIAVGGIGGRNLIRNGAPHFGQRSWAFIRNAGENIGTPTAVGREAFYLKPDPQYSGCWMESALFGLDVVGQYTVSFNLSISIFPGENALIDAYIVYPQGVAGLTQEVTRFVCKAAVTSPTKMRVSGTFTAEYPMAYLRIHNTNPHQRVAYLYDIQVQEGSTATAWTPNPSEIRASGITVNEDEITLDSHRLSILLRDSQDPETVALRMSADDKGFDRLVVGELSAGNVPTRQVTPLSLYVSPVGNDANDGLSTAKPKRTFGGALSAVPQMLSAPVSITCLAGYTYQESLSISGFTGGGMLKIAPSATWGSGITSISGSVEILGCACPVIMESFVITSNRHPIVQIEASPGVLLDTLRVTGSNRGNQHGISVSGATARLFNCITEFCSTGINCDAGMVFAYRCIGNNTGVPASAGILARRCGVVVISGTTPTGAGANTHTVEGGQILGSAPATPASGSPSTANTTTVVLSGSMATYRGSQWRSDANAQSRAIQGDYVDAGLNMGCLFFPGLKAMLAGKTVHSARLWVKRLGRGGYSAARPVYIGLCTAQSPTGTPTAAGNAIAGQLSWGQAQWLSLSAGVVQQIANPSGPFHSLCVYTAQSPKQNYVILEGIPQLEITYS